MSANEILQPAAFEYAEPVKRIYDSQGLHSFQTSVALYEIQKSLTKIVALVENKEVPDGVLSKELLYTEQDADKYSHDFEIPLFEDPQSTTLLQDRVTRNPYLKSLLSLFEDLSLLVDQVPPLEGPRRYGNLACRDYHTKFESKLNGLLTKYILPFYNLPNPDGFIKEIGWYLLNAFGSKERLDYGTGHELNFLAFITGLWKTRVIPIDNIDGYDFLIIFGKYYDLARKLITTYSLEPAGSHGVWGLDDHFHISYILGASELLNNSKTMPGVSPKMINNRSVVFQYSTKNLYFNSISFIYKVKKGAFFEHSPILYDVSNVKNWEKILKGMLKMYSAEVVNKFPVVQHFYFGGVLFPWRSIKNGSILPISTGEDSITEQSSSTSHSNNELQNKLSYPHQNDQIPLVSAPWKNKQSQAQSLQERLTSSYTSTRRSPTPQGFQQPQQQQQQQQHTRAPWAVNNQSGSQQPQETTRATWAKR
ncbi:Serine/threonine-protein phosphatase activator [Wickerhamomyces ciferrii]|uniref:Serine/threonine-protein phosphatase 2A activator n=1 Tax=Wickerhamomyces ciferrii (strain ATCC 14091 / BCRC 22168 / CBS 111 / JCM 3599 / NBRC 0793 / NRRL Y-1031 F-60-10) TaxID=1206466 RepID=K0KNQ9_WICCF|nr:Serine/threonine-protein phosphatase activator [Wickerhamomyces ciferrii]CCH43034.1 Serine/threonine-protein phosphatase activator [Wickerhamomyces ciferrii]